MSHHHLRLSCPTDLYRRTTHATLRERLGDSLPSLEATAEVSLPSHEVAAYAASGCHVPQLKPPQSHS